MSVDVVPIASLSWLRLPWQTDSVCRAFQSISPPKVRSVKCFLLSQLRPLFRSGSTSFQSNEWSKARKFFFSEFMSLGYHGVLTRSTQQELLPNCSIWAQSMHLLFPCNSVNWSLHRFKSARRAPTDCWSCQKKTCLQWLDTGTLRLLSKPLSCQREVDDNSSAVRCLNQQRNWL